MTSPVALVHAVPQLPTRDLRRTKEWYERFLGFDAPEGWERWQFLILRREGSALFFYPREGDAEPEEAGTVYLEVEGDIDGLAASLRTAGAELHGEPEDQPYGMREFVVHDPDGRHLRIGKRLGAAP